MTWIPDVRPLEPVPGRKFLVESEFEVKNVQFWLPEAKVRKNNMRKNYVLIKNEDEIKSWLKAGEEIGEFAIDTETNSLDPHQAKLVGISISNEFCFLHRLIRQPPTCQVELEIDHGTSRYFNYCHLSWHQNVLC